MDSTATEGLDERKSFLIAMIRLVRSGSPLDKTLGWLNTRETIVERRLWGKSGDEMESDLARLHSASGIYTATCKPALATTVQRYIDAVDCQFPLLKGCFGLEPQIQRYQVEIGNRGTCYGGSGNIALLENDPVLDHGPPECYDGALVFETIHGFLEPLRHPPRGVACAPIGENRLGESFSTIIEICFLERIGAHNAASGHKDGAGMRNYHHPLLFALVEIYEGHGIQVFQRLFSAVDSAGKSSQLLLDVQEFGREDEDPYTRKYRQKLAELFHEFGYIEVSDVLEERAAT